MKILRTIPLLLVLLPLGSVSADEATVQQLLKNYSEQGVTRMSKSTGKQMWEKQFSAKGEMRSCATCHTKDLAAGGKHATTNKAIKPMSPDVNAKRITKVKKVEKWFKRNCKWTLGRECSAQEKADYIAYIINNDQIKF